MLEISFNNSMPIVLTKKESIQLELKLNVTKKGSLWSSVGDYLYNYGIDKYGEDAKLIVTEEQMQFIQILMTYNSWKDCIKL